MCLTGAIWGHDLVDDSCLEAFKVLIILVEHERAINALVHHSDEVNHSLFDFLCIEFKLRNYSETYLLE